jgi:hypothetical protein
MSRLKYLHTPTKKTTCRFTSIIISLTTLAFGVFLPVLSGPQESLAFVNVVWGSVYGLGFLFLSWVPHPDPGILNLLMIGTGLLLWPLAVIWTIYIIYYRIICSGNTVLISIALIGFCLSLVWIVQIRHINNSLAYYLPIYSAFLE